jgi:hypothetical protein
LSKEGKAILTRIQLKLVPHFKYVRKVSKLEINANAKLHAKRHGWFLTTKEAHQCS